MYTDQLIELSNSLNDKIRCYINIKAGGRVGPILHSDLAVQNDFKTWVMIMLQNKDIYTKPVDWGPLALQYYMVYDNKDQLLVDDIYYFERYNDELKRLLNKLKKTHLISKIQKTNISINALPLDQVYDDELQRMVYEHVEKDFIAFNYSQDISNLNHL